VAAEVGTEDGALEVEADLEADETDETDEADLEVLTEDADPDDDEVGPGLATQRLIAQLPPHFAVLSPAQAKVHLSSAYRCIPALG